MCGPIDAVFGIQYNRATDVDAPLIGREYPRNRIDQRRFPRSRSSKDGGDPHRHGQIRRKAKGWPTVTDGNRNAHCPAIRFEMRRDNASDIIRAPMAMQADRMTKIMALRSWPGT